jgi:hypothetical protein
MQYGFGPLIAFAIFEILHSFLEIGARHIGEAGRGSLPWGVFDPIAGEAIPVIDPHPAKGAIPIEDKQWAVRHFLITPCDSGISISMMPSRSRMEPSTKPEPLVARMM